MHHPGKPPRFDPILWEHLSDAVRRKVTTYWEKAGPFNNSFPDAVGYAVRSLALSLGTHEMACLEERQMAATLIAGNSRDYARLFDAYVARQIRAAIRERQELEVLYLLWDLEERGLVFGGSRSTETYVRNAMRAVQADTERLRRETEAMLR